MTKIIFLICTLLSAHFSNEGQWEVLKTKNETSGRSECGLVTCNGKIYLVGGEGDAKPIEVFDPATKTWTKKAIAPVQMHHFQAVSYKNKIYVLEAFSGGGFPDQTPMSGVYIYDTDNDTWTSGAELTADRRRAGAGAAVYEGKLYLIDGIIHGHSSGTNSMFDEYDPQTNTWVKLSDAPHIRDHGSAAVIKDKLYAVGGRNTSYHEEGNFMSFFAKTVNEVDVYDFKTKKWNTLPAKLPVGSGGGAVVNLDDKLYYMGGERATATEPNAPRNTVYVLDPSSSQGWKEMESLKFARNGMSATVHNNTIYVFGGAGGPGGPPPGMNPGKNSTKLNEAPPQGNPNGPPPGPRPEEGPSPLEVFRLN